MALVLQDWVCCAAAGLPVSPLTMARVLIDSLRTRASPGVLPVEGRLLYGRAHCADCELRLVGHDVGGLDVPVVHGVLERCASVGVLVAHVAIKGDFGSSSAMRKITLLTKRVHQALPLQLHKAFFIFSIHFKTISSSHIRVEVRQIFFTIYILDISVQLYFIIMVSFYIRMIEIEANNT